MSLAANVLANVIAGIILIVGDRLLKGTVLRWKPDPRVALSVISLLLLLWGAANSYVIAYEPINAVAFFLVTATVLFFRLSKDFGPMLNVGIRGADIQVKSGIDYAKALKLAKNQLDFLGTGAAKLTSTGVVFEEALTRCHREGRPVRFLLMHPHGPALQRAARRAGVAPNEYQRRVEESLKKIGEIVQRRSLNVEVRLYKEPSVFRLMFIDEVLCLASYNVYGEGLGDGSQLPQLHVVRGASQVDTRSFYYPLAEYFRDRWEDAEPWDLRAGSWSHDE